MTLVVLAVCADPSDRSRSVTDLSMNSAGRHAYRATLDIQARSSGCISTAHWCYFSLNEGRWTSTLVLVCAHTSTTFLMT